MNIYISITPKAALCPFVISLLLLFTLPPLMSFLSLFIRAHFLEFYLNGNIQYVLSSLPSFTQCSYFQIHPQCSNILVLFIPLCGYTIICLFIDLLLAFGLFPEFSLLQWKLLWTFFNKSLYGQCFLFSWVISRSSMGDIIDVCLMFWEPANYHLQWVYHFISQQTVSSKSSISKSARCGRSFWF